MAFIDDLSRKLTQTSENAMQRTRQIAEVNRIESVIKQELQKMNDAYFQLGKAYVGLHPTDYEADFAYLITGIAESDQKIKSLRQQVRELKGITVCENCGAEVPINTVFCSTCGAPMPRTVYNADTENKVRCTKCGNYVPKNMRFCTSCGGPMVSLPQSQPNPAAQEDPFPSTMPYMPYAPTEAVPQPPYMPLDQAAPLPNTQEQSIVTTEPVMMPGDGSSGVRICPHCGAQIEDEQTLFCTECGMPL